MGVSGLLKFYLFYLFGSLCVPIDMTLEVPWLTARVVKYKSEKEVA